VELPVAGPFDPRLAGFRCAARLGAGRQPPLQYDARPRLRARRARRRIRPRVPVVGDDTGVPRSGGRPEMASLLRVDLRHLRARIRALGVRLAPDARRPARAASGAEGASRAMEGEGATASQPDAETDVLR